MTFGTTLVSSRLSSQRILKLPDPKDGGTMILPNAGMAQLATQGNTLKHPNLHKSLTIKSECTQPLTTVPSNAFLVKLLLGNYSHIS